MDVPEDRMNVVQRFFSILSRPENLSRLLRWVWFLSLFVLILGYIIIFTKIRHFLSI